jgi:hypothetical protein
VGWADCALKAVDPISLHLFSDTLQIEKADGFGPRRFLDFHAGTFVAEYLAVACVIAEAGRDIHDVADRGVVIAFLGTDQAKRGIALRNADT